MHNVTFPEFEATVNGVRLHYVRQGAGAPLLLVHGWPGFWYEWHLNIGPLSERYDVVAPDMRGYAYSDKPAGPPEQDYTDTAFAGDILGLIDHLGWDKVNIVSHDFGAIWVQKFARLHPDRMGKLMLFDPPYQGTAGRSFQLPDVFNVWYQFFHQLPLAEELIGSSRKATELYLRHFLSTWSADKNLFTDEEIEKYVEAYSQPGALRGGFNCYRAAYRGGAFSAGGTPTVETPTRVLWGDSDQIFPFAWSDKLKDFFPNSDLRKIEGAGHFMMREAPERVNAEIVEWLG